MTTPTAVPLTRAPKSTFVTVVAWLGIAGCGFGSLVSLLQNVMVHTVFRSGGFTEALRDSVATAPVPAPARALFLHFPLFVFGMLVVVVTGLIASIGLLQRRNWARLLFIALLALGVVSQLLGLVVQASFFDAFPADLPAGPPDAPDFATVFRAMRVVMTVLGIGFAGLFGWVAWRFTTPAIRAEFD